MGFPILCHHRERSHEEDNRKIRTWDEQTLGHIQIKYMAKFSDAVRYLASIQSLPAHLRPQLGIVLDDIECFVDDVMGSESKDDGYDGVLEEVIHMHNQNTPTAIRNPFLSNEQAMKLMHMSE